MSRPDDIRRKAERLSVEVKYSGRQPGADAQADNQRAQEQHHEDAKQPLRDGGRGRLDVGKAEYTGHNRNQ